MKWAVHLPGWPDFRLFQLSSAALSVAMDDAAVMGAELTKTRLIAGKIVLCECRQEGQYFFRYAMDASKRLGS